MADDEPFIPDYATPQRPEPEKPPAAEGPCAICGTTLYEWGRLHSTFFEPLHQATWFEKNLMEVWARRCMKCSNVQLFGPPVEQ